MKRPLPRLSPKSGSPVKNPNPEQLVDMAERARYKGSPKHKFGVYHGQVGRPRARPTTVQQAQQQTPIRPYTMICPAKWNSRLPDNDATTLLRNAIKLGQIGHPIINGLPEVVWARDPEERDIIYQAQRLSGTENCYYAYPMIEPEVDRLGIKIK